MRQNKPLDSDFQAMADEIANYQVERFYEAQSRRDRRAAAQNVDGDYSLTRVFNALQSDRLQQLAPYEYQVSQRLAEQLGRQPKPGNVFVPVPMRRDLNVATPSAGGYLVSSSTGPGGLFVHYLDAFFPFQQLGIQRLTLLQPCTVPGVSANVSTISLANETSTITESQFVFATSTSTPKNLGAYTEISHSLLMSTTPVAQAFVMQALARAVAAELSRQILVGTGSNGQILGIFNYPGVLTVAAASANLTTFTNMVEQVEQASALLSPPSAAFVMRSNIAKMARTREKVSGSGMLMTRNDLSGFPTVVTGGTSANTATFGDWSQLVLLEYGALEIGTDPYGVNSDKFKAGIVGIRVWWTADVILTNPSSFCVSGALS